MSTNPTNKPFFSMRTGLDPDYYKNQASYNEHTISCKKAKNKNYYPQVFTDNRGHTYFRTRGTYVDTGNFADVSKLEKEKEKDDQ